MTAHKNYGQTVPEKLRDLLRNFAKFISKNVLHGLKRTICLSTDYKSQNYVRKSTDRL